MSQPHNRSLNLALGRLRFAVVTACWVIALCFTVQVVIWSLCTFTEVRYGDEAASGDVPLIVEGDAKGGTAPGGGAAGATGRRWRPDPAAAEEQAPRTSAYDRAFKILVTVARTMGMMGALIICPLMALGVILGVPAGAPRVERAVTALIWGIVLALLSVPLGGWFGLAWNEGAFTDYLQMVAAVESANDAQSISPTFFGRFLILPLACAAGFILVGFQFSAAVEAVLLKRQYLDPELEKEAANVAATSLHGTGRTAGALNKALEEDRKKKKKTPSMSRASAGEMPKRLI